MNAAIASGLVDFLLAGPPIVGRAFDESRPLKVIRASGKVCFLESVQGRFPILPAMGDFLLEIGKHGAAQGNRNKVVPLCRQLAVRFPELQNAFSSSDKRTRRKTILWRCPLLKGMVREG